LFEDLTRRQEAIVAQLTAHARFQNSIPFIPNPIPKEEKRNHVNQEEKLQLSNPNLNRILCESQLRLSWGVYTGGLGVGFGTALLGLSTVITSLFPNGITKLWN